MRLIEALVELEKGKNVRRKCWEPDMYILKDINNNYVTCNGVTYIIDDFNSNDWEVIDTREDIDIFWKMLYDNLGKLEPMFKDMVKRRQCHQHFQDHKHHFRECRNCMFEEPCKMYVEIRELLEDLNKYYKIDVLPFDKEEHEKPDHGCHDKFEDHVPSDKPNYKEEHNKPNHKEENKKPNYKEHDRFDDHVKHDQVFPDKFDK